MAHIQLPIAAERSGEFSGIVGRMTFHSESAGAIITENSSDSWLVVDVLLRGE